MDFRSVQEMNARVERESEFLRDVRSEIRRVIVGQDRLIDRVLMALLANGHILLEGVPGLAKTLLIRTVSDTIHADFSRLQFTPDLLPADLIGTQIYNQHKADFTVRKGPVFSNLVLADEINRAPAKVQSALLEAMQERQVTIGDETFKMEDLFLVMATQNPIEQEGTYPLPEAQVDRFMMKVIVTYPTRAEERIIMDRMTGVEEPAARAVVDKSEFLDARAAVKNIYVDDKIKEYVLDLISATRDPERYRFPELVNQIDFGASPRASIYMIQAARAHAFINGRGYVAPDDIKEVAPDVLRHRIITTYEAEAQDVTGDDIVRVLLERTHVP